MAKQSLSKRLGRPPLDDSLGTISWMQRALGEMAADVIEGNLNADDKRDALLAIADRMAKLRDPDRLYRAEQNVLGKAQRLEEKRPGPSLTNAPQIDSSATPVVARRGRPPRSAIR